MILVVILYALLALTFPLSQYALIYTGPVFLIAFRMLLASAFLLGYHFLTGGRFNIRKEDWWLFIKTSFFYIYLAFIPEFWALQYISSLKTTIMYSLTPFITAFLEYTLLHGRLTKNKMIGMLIGTTGIVPLLMLPNTQCLPLGQCKYPFLAEAMLLLAIIAGAYAWFLIKDLSHKGYSLTFINGTTMAIGGIMSSITYVFTDPLSQRPVSEIGPFLFYTLALIIISNVIVYNLYGYLLKHYSVTFVSFAGFLSPLFGTLYAWLFFRERISWQYFISFIFVSIGLSIFYRGEQNRS
jgi:drug/metabolite transporter (DMT)-like permease